MRFGLFGTGPWAHLAHAPALAAHESVEFVGVWGRNPEKAAELATQYGATAYPDVDALIADVEAVAIALPPDIQAPIALKAARSGKHLLLDKPVAFTTEEADEIVAAVTERGLSSVVFFTRRLMPQIEEFVADAQRAGGWLEGRVDHVGSIYTEGNPFGASAWRRESGGLWDVGPHAFALLLPILGPVTEVAALAGPRDMTHVLARHSDGAISALTTSVDAPPAAGREDAMIAGEAGVRVVPEAPWEPVWALEKAISQLVAGAGSELDVRFGARITAILVAAQEAVKTGRAIKV